MRENNFNYFFTAGRWTNQRLIKLESYNNKKQDGKIGLSYRSTTWEKSKQQWQVNHVTSYSDFTWHSVKRIFRKQLYLHLASKQHVKTRRKEENETTERLEI